MTQYLGQKFVYIKQAISQNEEEDLHLEGDADINRYEKAVVKIEDAKSLEPFGNVTCFPGANYGILNFELYPDAISVGPSLARHIASALRRCVEEFGATTTNISAAKDVYGESTTSS